jgi:hypothetical protein
MKLRYETKRVLSGQDTDFPDHAYCFAYSGIGVPTGQPVEVSYLVPSDTKSAMMARAMEIAHHLLGLTPIAVEAEQAIEEEVT